VCAVWVPGNLTDYHKPVRKDVGSNLLMVKAFCHALSMGMKHGSITLNGRQKRQSVEWHNPTFSVEEEV
jgi:hypothetical protein